MPKNVHHTVHLNKYIILLILNNIILMCNLTSAFTISPITA